MQRLFSFTRLAAVPVIVMFLIPEALLGAQEAHGVMVEGTPETAWWVWPLVLFVMTFVMGILAALSGVGGAVLFVPIVSGFFPFHFDFVRGTGLLVALSGALAAGPGFLRMNLAKHSE